MARIAMISLHGCPVARLGEKDTGGMNVYVLQMARSLARLGHVVDVFTRAHNPTDEEVIELAPNARVIHLQAGKYDHPKKGLDEHVPEFIDALAEFAARDNAPYDIVHSHYWFSGLVGIEFARRWNVPHIAMFHTTARTKLMAKRGEDEPERRSEAEAEIMRASDAIVVSTEQEREDQVRLYRAATFEKTHVIPAGVDLNQFKPIEKRQARRTLGLCEDWKIILSVGRIEPLKGLDILLGAMALLEDKARTRLLIVGGNEGDIEFERLKRIATNLGLQDMVRFTGTVPQADLPLYYSAADVFVLPSYYESFGLVALEAMACGAPVISARVGGPRTFLKGGISGYIIPWHCPEPYAQRLDMILSNPDLQASMGRAAREVALDMGWEGVAQKTTELYASLMGTECKEPVPA